MNPPTPPPDEHAKAIDELAAHAQWIRNTGEPFTTEERLVMEVIPAIRALQDDYTELRAIAEKMAEALTGYVEKSSRFEPDNVYQQKLAEALAEWRKWEERK